MQFIHMSEEHQVEYNDIQFLLHVGLWVFLVPELNTKRSRDQNSNFKNSLHLTHIIKTNAINYKKLYYFNPLKWNSNFFCSIWFRWVSASRSFASWIVWNFTPLLTALRSKINHRNSYMLTVYISDRKSCPFTVYDVHHKDHSVCLIMEPFTDVKRTTFFYVIVFAIQENLCSVT